MYLVHPRARGRHVPRLGAWFRQAVRPHQADTSRQPATPRVHYLDYLDGLTGRTGGTYRQGRAKELEQAWRDGEISYRTACCELEELDGEP